MLLKKIVLENFRNYYQEEVFFSDTINYIIGDNAQGKTNLLEAIFFVLNGESFKSIKEEEIFNKDSDNKRSTITLDIFHNNKNYSVKMEKTDKEKLFTINNIKKRIGKNTIKTILFLPDDLQIIKEGPSRRRTFLDNEIKIIYPNYHDILKNYYKIISQKNFVLKTSKDISLLSIFNKQLALTGQEIIRYRLDYLKNITPIARDIYKKITDNKETLSISYKPSFNFKNYEEELQSNIEEEIKKKQSMIGIHRDDIVFYINSDLVKNFASQGQQRSIILAIKIAELQYLKKFHQYFPILLLDDVFSELDNKRKEMLTKILDDYQIQSFITLTNKELIKINDNSDCKIIMIRNGKVI